MLVHGGRAENGLGQVCRTLKSEVASLENRASQTNRIAPDDSLGQHGRQGPPWLASSGGREIGSRELGYMSCVMKRGNMREVAGI
ncbi:MAG TPA: hypothetical protein VJV79_33755 [Polyangiaceae bacterium]|nr:hypothetical protein [Polyangiaceae bacterium]